MGENNEGILKGREMFSFCLATVGILVVAAFVLETPKGLFHGMVKIILSRDQCGVCFVWQEPGECPADYRRDVVICEGAPGGDEPVHLYGNVWLVSGAHGDRDVVFAPVSFRR